jgi:hypothetical protein
VLIAVAVVMVVVARVVVVVVVLVVVVVAAVVVGESVRKASGSNIDTEHSYCDRISVYYLNHFRQNEYLQ